MEIKVQRLLQPWPGYESVHAAISQVLLRSPCERNPLLIGIDGRDGSGKSSLANWLAWQLGIEAVHLDMFLECKDTIIGWREDELSRVVSSRLGKHNPVIVEGVKLLEAMEAIDRCVDFLVFVIKADDRSFDEDCVLELSLKQYFEKYMPENKAKHSFQQSELVIG